MPTPCSRLPPSSARPARAAGGPYGRIGGRGQCFNGILPAQLWGTQADRAFLSIDHNPTYYDYGPDEPTHIPFYTLGGAYHQPRIDLKRVPRAVLLKNVYHRRYMIRTQAAKALREVGAIDELETLLRNADPRVRRAGLDGLIDYNYWFAIGRKPISTEQFSPECSMPSRRCFPTPTSRGG